MNSVKQIKTSMKQINSNLMRSGNFSETMSVKIDQNRAVIKRKTDGLQHMPRRQENQLKLKFPKLYRLECTIISGDQCQS